MPENYGTGLGTSEQFGTTSYGFFSTGHIVQIAVTACVLGMLFLLCFKKKSWLNAVLWICMIFGSLNMAALVTYSVITGIYNVEWYLPLHICNLFIIILPLATFCKGKVRTFLMDYIVGGGLGGCCLAILFPATSQLYFPPFHFVSVMIWTYHIMIGFLGGFMIISGNYRRFKCNSVIMLISVLLLISYIINPLLKTNFLFTNPNRAFIPTNVIFRFLGNYGIIYIAMFVFGIAIGTHSGFWFYERIKKRSVVQLLKDWGVIDFFLKHRFDKEVMKSEFYLYITKTKLARRVSKKLKKDTNIFNKLYKAILESGLVETLLNSRIENLANINELGKTIIDSSIIMRISDAVALSDLLKIVPQKRVKADSRA